ncbi:hypothetical protein D3C79_501360 [compost metagenome]
MKLRYDNPLSTVDHKGAVFGHERNLAHIDFLFLDVFDRTFRSFALIDYQAQFYAQRCRVRHTTDLALFDVEHRLTKTVANVLQLRIATVALDRENRTECGFKAVLPFWVLLDKLLERVKLDRKEIWYVQNLWTLTKILTNTFFLGIGVNHRVPQLAGKSNLLSVRI